MFGPRYFGSRYYGRRYFGKGGAGAPATVHWVIDTNAPDDTVARMTVFNATFTGISTQGSVTATAGKFSLLTTDPSALVGVTKRLALVEDWNDNLASTNFNAGAGIAEAQ